MASKKLLFLPSNQTALHGMVQLYKEAEKRGHICKLLIEPRIKFNGDYQVIELEVPDNGVPDKRKSSFHLNPILSLLPDFLKKLLRLIKNIISTQFNKENKEIRNWIKIQKQRENETSTILELEKPDIVYTYGDRHGGYEPALIKQSKKRNIPVVIPPIAYATDKEGLLVSARKLSATNGSICVTNDKEFKKKYPLQWVHDELTGEDYSYYPRWMVIARDRCGVLPKNPWTLGGGDSTIICADSEKTQTRFIHNGVKPEKILVTGHFNHDKLRKLYHKCDELREHLLEKYSLERHQKMVIIGLPQLAEHGICDWDTHWHEIRFLLQTIKECNTNTLVSLHPKMDIEKYKFIAKDYGLEIAEESLVEILPAADIFAATFSSTVQWAVLCRIPAIVFDFYSLNYTMYDFLSGVQIINKKENLFPALKKLIDDEIYYNDMVNNQNRLAPYLSPFDGMCVERVIDAVPS